MPTDLDLELTKKLRKDIQKTIDILNSKTRTRSSSLAITKLEEGKMWLGKHMGEMGGEDLNAKRDAQ